MPEVQRNPNLGTRNIVQINQNNEKKCLQILEEKVRKVQHIEQIDWMLEDIKQH